MKTVEPDKLFTLLDRGRRLETDFRLYLMELESLLLERREPLKESRGPVDPRTGKPFRQRKK